MHFSVSYCRAGAFGMLLIIICRVWMDHVFICKFAKMIALLPLWLTPRSLQVHWIGMYDSFLHVLKS